MIVLFPEPLGGAHRDFDAVATSISEALESSLRELRALNSDQLLEKRYQRLMSFGKFNS